jgi:hypothetical protein
VGSDGETKPRVLPRAGGGLAILASAACVAAMALGKPNPEAPGFVGDISPRKVSLPAALRPMPIIRADIGAPSARPLLAGGFGPDERIGKRSAASTIAGRANLVLPLYPDPAGVTLSLLARTASGVAPHSVTLVVNGGEARALAVTAGDWLMHKIVLPESTLVSGRNQVEILSEVPTGGLALDLLRIDSASAQLAFDVGAPTTRQWMTKGWGSDETIGGRSAARLRPPNGELMVRLRPVAADYVLGILAMSEGVDKSLHLPVEVNSAKPGMLAPAGEYGPSFLRIPRSALHVGENVIKLVVAPNAHFAIDFLVLQPIETDVFLDIGTPEGRQNLGKGFSVDETSGLGTSTWSDAPSSHIVVWMAPLATPYRLSVHASALPPLAPLGVEVTLNGKSLGSFLAGPHPDTYDMDVPAGTAKDGQNVIEFKYAATRQPRQVDARSQDTRHLALRYDWLELTPKL